MGKLCDEGSLSPTVFYRWQETLFREGARLFERAEAVPETRKTEQEKIERLEKSCSRRMKCWRN